MSNYAKQKCVQIFFILININLPLCCRTGFATIVLNKQIAIIINFVSLINIFAKLLNYFKNEKFIYTKLKANLICLFMMTFKLFFFVLLSCANNTSS